MKLDGDGAPRYQRLVRIFDLGINIERIGIRARTVVGEGDARGRFELCSVRALYLRRPFLAELFDRPENGSNILHGDGKPHAHGIGYDHGREGSRRRRHPAPDREGGHARTPVRGC